MANSHHTPDDQITQQPVTIPPRRHFLGVLGWFCVSAIGLVVTAAGAMFATFPAFNGAKRGEQWYPIGGLDQLPEGASEHNLTVVDAAGWAQANTKQAVWVVRSGKQLQIFSAICPHEGCTISQQATGQPGSDNQLAGNNQQTGFICRCHLSSWQPNGQKIAGPTPRDMDTLEHRVNNDQIEVKYQLFKRAVPEKIPIT